MRRTVEESCVFGRNSSYEIILTSQSVRISSRFSVVDDEVEILGATSDGADEVGAWLWLKRTQWAAAGRSTTDREAVRAVRMTLANDMVD